MDDRQQTIDGVKVIFLEDPKAIVRALLRMLDDLTVAPDEAPAEVDKSNKRAKLTSDYLY